MKHVKLFESHEDVDPATLVYDEAEDAYRDPVSGFFANPNSGGLFPWHKTAKDLPLRLRKRHADIKIDYVITPPSVFAGCYDRYDLLNGVKEGKFTEKDIIEFAKLLVSTEELDELGLTIEDANSFKTLYHGTSDKVARIIEEDGFKITKGTRNMGAHIMGGIVDYDVQNQGIFLSDNYDLAKYYGTNRSGGSAINTKVINVSARIKKTLDLTSAATCPKNIKALVTHTYQKVNENIFNKGDLWTVVDDRGFVDSIKAMGYDSVMFRESKQVLKESGAANGFTYIVFNPNSLYILKARVNTNTALQFVGEYLNSGDIHNKWR